MSAIVYVIECQTPNHFYVGATSHYDDRIKRHGLGRGARWTQIHGFKKVIKKMEVPTMYLAKIFESKEVDRRIALGEEVRGASYTSVRRQAARRGP